MNTPDKSVDEDIRTKRGEEKEVQQHRNSSMNSQINIQSKKKVKTNQHTGHSINAPAAIHWSSR